MTIVRDVNGLIEKQLNISNSEFGPSLQGQGRNRVINQQLTMVEVTWSTFHQSNKQ